MLSGAPFGGAIIGGAAAFVPSAACLLDVLPADITIGSARSMRRLLSSYFGPCLRVQRSSDNTEADIGFGSDGNLNQVALLAFVGAGGDAFVSVWYDQSGNGYHALQTLPTYQPQIVAGGAIIVGHDSNGNPTTRPSILFDNTSRCTLLEYSQSITGTDHTFLTVGELTVNNGASSRIWSLNSAGLGSGDHDDDHTATTIIPLTCVFGVLGVYQQGLRVYASQPTAGTGFTSSTIFSSIDIRLRVGTTIGTTGYGIGSLNVGLVRVANDAYSTSDGQNGRFSEMIELVGTLAATDDDAFAANQRAWSGAN